MVRLGGLFRIERQAQQQEQELAAELESHLQFHIDDNLRAGMTPVEARRDARIKLGGVEQTKQAYRERSTFPFLENLFRDVRYALRQLRKSPGFTITAILTLAIGIGANAAIFTVINDAMLRTLPVKKPSQLVVLGYRSPKLPQLEPMMFLSARREITSHFHSVLEISGWYQRPVTVPDSQNTLRSLPAGLVTGNAFSLLGIQPFIGRVLMPFDDVPGGPEGDWPAVLNYSFWQANYHGDPSVIGRHLLISGQPSIIVGVLPPDFEGIFVGQPKKLYLPMHFLSALAPSPAQDPYQHPDTLAYLPLARLAPGSTLASLNAELRSLSTPTLGALLPQRLRNSPSFRDAYLSADSASRGFSLIRLRYSKPLFLIQGIVLAVLLLCCFNLAGLQIARMQVRSHEFAVRLALGAPRARILQQCLTESLVIAILGSIFAAGLAWSTVRAISQFFTPSGAQIPIQLQPDSTVFLISGALALLTTILFGLIPGLFAGRIPPSSLLTVRSAASTRSGLGHRLLIPAQFSLALALVFTAGLFAHTLHRLRSNDVGFDPSHVTIVTAQFEGLKTTPEQIMQLYHNMTDFLNASPGIQKAAYTKFRPITLAGREPRITVHSAAHSDNDSPLAYNNVGYGYFDALGTRLLSGREFSEQDGDRSVCILNKAAAKLLFGQQSPISEQLHASQGDHSDTSGTECRVIGVAEDARTSSLRDPAPPTIFFPAGVSSVAGGGLANNLTLCIRSQRRSDATEAYRAALARFAPSTGYMAFSTLEEDVDRSIGSERLIAQLSATFAVIALVLSSVGLFGMLTLQVQRRLPEMSLRIALGASRIHILGLVLRCALVSLGIGIALGSLLIAFASTLTRRFLYETSSLQLSVVAASLGVLLLVALVAAVVPARRAANIDPMQALRAE